MSLTVPHCLTLLSLLAISSAGMQKPPLGGGPETTRPPRPMGPRVTAPPQSLGLDPFYKKYVDASGIPVVSSDRVPDEALWAARDLAVRMLKKRPDVARAMAAKRTRIAVMGEKEVTVDVPEHRTLKPAAYWNARARGLGATPSRPASSCAEENLLGYPTDRYGGESIFIHEFAHSILGMGLEYADRPFVRELEAAYGAAMKEGLFKKTYAATDVQEYWAEGVQSWFDANSYVEAPNGIHNEVNSREELEAYDPRLAKVIARVFPSDWRWVDPLGRWRK